MRYFLGIDIVPERFDLCKFKIWNFPIKSPSTVLRTVSGGERLDVNSLAYLGEGFIFIYSA